MLGCLWLVEMVLSRTENMSSLSFLCSECPSLLSPADFVVIHGGVASEATCRPKQPGRL